MDRPDRSFGLVLSVCACVCVRACILNVHCLLYVICCCVTSRHFLVYVARFSQMGCASSNNGGIPFDAISPVAPSSLPNHELPLFSPDVVKHIKLLANQSPINLMVIGPPGSGKTTFIHTVQRCLWRYSAASVVATDNLLKIAPTHQWTPITIEDTKLTVQ